MGRKRVRKGVKVFLGGGFETDTSNEGSWKSAQDTSVGREKKKEDTHETCVTSRNKRP